MTPAADIRRRAIELIEQLSPERLTAVVQLLEFLSEPSHQAASSSQELARLRNIDLLTLNRQFVSQSHSFHAV